MNVYPSVDKETGKDTWGASFGIIESNLANVGYAANPTDDGDLYDSLYATVEARNWFCTWPTSPATPAMSTASS